MKMALFVALLPPLLLAAVPAQAQVPKRASGESCARIDEAARRLICYDLIFRTGANAADPLTGASAPPQEQVDLSALAVDGWPVTTTPSPIGPGRFVTVTTESAKPMSDSDQLAKLTVTCGNGNTSLSFWFPGHYMSSDERTLEASIDGAEAQKFTTTGYDSQMAINASATALPFIQQLMEANTVVVSAKPSSGPKFSATFSLDGMTKAMAPIRQSCGW
jgi:hypothetical protein